MASSMPESVFELGIEFSEANNVFLMSLLEETQEDEYCGDDRLVSIMQSLEAEISDPLLGQSTCEVGHVDNQDCPTSVCGTEWVDMEVFSGSPFDDEMNAWIPCGDEMEDVAMEYEAGNDIDYSQLYYGVFLEQQHTPTYSSQGTTDALF